MIKQGKYEEAAVLLREAIAINRAAYGEEHPRSAECMANLARVYLAQGRATAAEPMARLSLGIRRRVLRDSNWQTASSESLLGAVLTGLGRYDEAEPLLLHAQQVLKDIPGAQGHEAQANREPRVATSIVIMMGRSLNTAPSTAESTTVCPRARS